MSALIPEILTKATTEAASNNAPKWAAIMPRIEKDMASRGLDRVPKNIAEIVAKIETDESNKKKGLIVSGTPGTGKTVRFKFIAETLGIKMITAHEVVRCLLIDGEEGLRELCRLDISRYGSVPPHYYDLIIDDIGAEPTEQIVYGTRFNAIADIIERRYLIFPQWKTHFSTNLTKEQLTDRYGERVFSRMNEMCHFVTLTGKDRRTNA